MVKRWVVKAPKTLVASVVSEGSVTPNNPVDEVEMVDEKGWQVATKVARRSGPKSLALSGVGRGFEILVRDAKVTSSARMFGFDSNIIK